MRLQRRKSPTRPRRRNPFAPPPTNPIVTARRSPVAHHGQLRRKRRADSSPCAPDGYATHVECILHPDAPILHVRYHYVCTSCAQPPTPRREFPMHRTRPARKETP